MSSKRELADIIMEQIEIEKESVRRLSETEKKVGSGAARLLVCEMRMDSQKHADVLEAMLEVLKSPQSSGSSWERALHSFVDPAIVRKEIENHMALEKSMSSHIQEETAKTDVEVIRTLLSHLGEDEKKHRAILDTIVQNCYKMIR